MLSELRSAGARVGKNLNHIGCPWHGDDSTGSLSVKSNEDGVVFYNCHGCGEKGDVISLICKNRNCEFTDAVKILTGTNVTGLSQQSKSPSPKKKEEPKKELPKHDSYESMIASVSDRAERKGYKFVKAWNYTDPITGKIEYVTMRMDQTGEFNSKGKQKKQFLPAHAIATGFQEGGTKVNPIYRRKEILGADTVVVVEGEKCADALIELGIIATTSPSGAKGANNADWTPLKDKSVIIWPDNDEDGSGYANDVESILSRLDPPCVVRRVHVPKDLPEGGDVVDYIESLRMDGKDDDATISSIYAFLDAAEKVGFFANHITLKELVSYDTSDDPNCLLGKRWICKGGSCLFAGQTGLGKSTLAMQCSILWALGRSAFGIPAIKPMKSVFIQAENDIGDMAEQCQGVIKAMDLEDHIEDLNNMIKFVTEDGKCGDAFTGFKDPNDPKKLGRIESSIGYLESIVRYYKPDLVWVDPLHAYIGGDINKAEICARFLRSGLNPLGHKYGCAWMIAHHTTKPKSADEKKGMTHSDYSYQGAGSAELANWARATMSIHQREDGLYELKTNKRWKRALLSASSDPFAGENNPTSCIILKHSQHGLCWLVADAADIAMHDEKKDIVSAMVQVGMEYMVMGKQYEVSALRAMFAKAVGKAVATTYTKHSPVCQAFAILMANCKVPHQPNLFTLPHSFAKHSPSHSPSADEPNSPIRQSPVGVGDGELANCDGGQKKTNSQQNLPWDDSDQGENS